MKLFGICSSSQKILKKFVKSFFIQKSLNSENLLLSYFTSSIELEKYELLDDHNLYTMNQLIWGVIHKNEVCISDINKKKKNL